MTSERRTALLLLVPWTAALLLLSPAGCAKAVTAESGGGGTATTSTTGGGGTTGTGATGGTETGGGGTMTFACTLGQKQDCYDGPPGTANVGICKEGTQLCLADGSGFGPCEGQVLPGAEDCGTPLDEDCNGLVNDACVCAAGSTMPCYTGPGQTLGTGACKGGMKTCLPDGSGFGPCVGEVVPVPEDCATFLDDDCDGQVNEANAGCDPAECAGCMKSEVVCASSAVVVGHYDGGPRTICIGQGDGSTFELALLTYEAAEWTLTGATARVTTLQVYSYDPPTTVQGNAGVPTGIQIGGSVPADPYDYAMSLSECPAHTGYAGAVFGVPQAEVCHMESGLFDACSSPAYTCLAISP